MRWTALTLLVMAAASTLAGEYNSTLSIGDKAPAWNALPGVDGNTHSLADLKDKDIVVVVFTCNSCPYAVDYEDRLIAFAEDVQKRSLPVSLVAINVNKNQSDSLEAMKARAKKKGFNFPYLFDESQKIAKDFGATRTPEFFVLNKQREIAYMGAMDDNTNASKVAKTYVRDAVEALLDGKKVAVTETPPVGCGIRFERSRRRQKTSQANRVEERNHAPVVRTSRGDFRHLRTVDAIAGKDRRPGTPAELF